MTARNLGVGHRFIAAPFFGITSIDLQEGWLKGELYLISLRVNTLP
jgi:hypothetical protein